MRTSTNHEDLSQAAAALKSLSPDELGEKYLPKAKSGRICPNPNCRDGSGRDGTGITVYPDRGNGYQYYCGKCDRAYDNIDVIGFYHGLDPKTDFPKIIEKASADFDIPYIAKQIGDRPRQKIEDKPEIKNKFQKEIEWDCTRLYQIANYDTKYKYRGLTKETLEAFKIGYDPKWYARKSDPLTPRVIIPSSYDHYLARYYGDDEECKKLGCKPKEHRGSKEIFNFKRAIVESSDPIVFVFEGELDCMSAVQASNWQINCVALSGSTFTPKIHEQIKNLQVKKNFVVLLDNDETGKEKAPLIVATFKSYGHNAIQMTFDGTAKDANELLQASPELLTARLERIYDDAKKFFDSLPDENLFPRWEKDNGKLNPDMLAQIKDAKNLIDDLCQKTFTPDDIQTADVKRALALCQFFDPYTPAVNKFYVTLDKIKDDAAAQISSQKAINASIADDDRAWDNFSKAKFKEAVTKIFKQVQREHKDYQKVENARRAEEKRAKEVEARNAIVEKNLKQLAKLREQPQSPERDQKIIQVINDTCEWRYNVHQEPIAVKDTAANFKLIFTYDPNLDNLCAFDEFQQTVVFRKPPIWKNQRGKKAQEKNLPQPIIDNLSPVGAEWRDTDNDQLNVYLASTYTDLFNVQKSLAFLVDFSQRRAFNEAHDFIYALPDWDGTPRAETVFIKFLGAKDTEFNRAITKNWLIGSMARLFVPGCDYQLCLVLTGAQRIGKSRLLEMLGGKRGVNPLGKGFHISVKDKLDDPHAIDAIQKGWIVELEEGVAQSKADVNAAKAFISAAEDTRRPAYGRHAVTIKRHCVIAITTNNPSFLRDPTGNARFGVIECSTEMFNQVEGMTVTYIRQVLAEAFHWFKQLFEDKFDESRLRLPLDIQIANEQHNENFLQDDGMETELRTWLDIKLPPPAIWNNFSRQERAEFCTNGGRISIIEAPQEFKTRRRNAGHRRTLMQDLNDIENFFAQQNDGGDKNISVRQIPVMRGGHTVIEYVIYGSEYRQHVCLAEIIAECFARSDRRKSPARINELFNALIGDDWDKTTVTYYDDPVYPKQRNMLVRITQPTDQDDKPAESNEPMKEKLSPWAGELIDPDDMPF